jgi:hypothetical protein
MDIHSVDFGTKKVTWKCSQCGHENEYDKETADKALEVAKEGMKAVPVALLFGALKALGWLFIGIAALKFAGVI